MKYNIKDKYKKNISNGNIAVWLMMFPAIFLVCIVSIYPFFWIFRYIFYDYNGFTAYFVGMDNFTRLFRDGQYWQSVLQTFEYAFLKIVIIIPLALLIAVILNGALKGRNIFRMIIFIPTVISAAVYSLIWYFIYSPYNGVLNGIINSIGITSSKIDWLGNPKIAMLSIIAVAVWGGLGNYMILFLAGLQSVPADIYESSKIDGTNKIQDFFYITLPMMAPMLKIILMLAITTALKDYESIMVLTSGGPLGKTNVMFLYVYNLMFGNENISSTIQIGYGTVVGLASSLIIGIITVIYLKASKKLDQLY